VLGSCLQAEGRSRGCRSRRAAGRSLRAYLVNELPSSPATWLESATGRLLLAHLGHAEALCELFSSLDYSRTRVEEVLVAQALHVIEAALAQEPHVLLVDLPDIVDCLSAVLACWDGVFRHRVAVRRVAVGLRRVAVGLRRVAVGLRRLRQCRAPRASTRVGGVGSHADSSSRMSSGTLSFWLLEFAFTLSGEERNATADLRGSTVLVAKLLSAKLIAATGCETNVFCCTIFCSMRNRALGVSTSERAGALSPSIPL